MGGRFMVPAGFTTEGEYAFLQGVEHARSCAQNTMQVKFHEDTCMTNAFYPKAS